VTTVTTTISAAQVKQLREATSAGMMECKKVLAETGGDFDEAVKLLRERGQAQAAKLGGRATTEGAVGSYVDGDSLGVLVEIGCNTDFVARNDDFQKFVADIARHVADNSPSDVAELLSQPSPSGDGTVEDLRAQTSASTGENIEIRRFERYESTDGVVGAYVHGGKIGVLVEVAGPTGNDDVRGLVRDVAMHAAAMAPEYVSKDQVPTDRVEAEREIFIKQAEDKPEAIRGKIADGKIQKWYSEVALLDQQWVKGKDVFGKDTTIDELRAKRAEELGQDLQIRRFTRFQLGQA
jgi:elongation factor Ts